MTDRYNALTVVLDQNIREDDAEAIIAAIGQIRHVVSVVPHVADTNAHVAEARARMNVRERLLKVVMDL